MGGPRSTFLFKKASRDDLQSADRPATVREGRCKLLILDHGQAGNIAPNSGPRSVMT
jgi:hypothetical protein